jgi:hypothetical protein
MSLHEQLTTLPPAQHAIIITERYKEIGAFIIEAVGERNADVKTFKSKKEEDTEIVRRCSVYGKVNNKKTKKTHHQDQQ